jgi:hypothetical protein
MGNRDKGGDTMRKLLVLSVLVVGVMAVATATAGRPVTTRMNFDATFPDDFLSAACGFEVTTHARGHAISREFDRAKGTVAVSTLNIALTAMANGNTYRFRDVGADHVKITKDGPILSIVGQIPFEFIGVLKIDLDTDEVVHEPGHDISGRIADACAALAA